jgi:hypothetical protein
MKLICLTCLLASSCLALPAPQQDTSDLGSDYGDYDASVQGVDPQSGGLEDFLGVGAGLAEAFLSLISDKVKFITGLLSDKDFQDTVGNTIETTIGVGVNLSRAAVPVAHSILGAVPGIINATMGAVSTTQQVVSSPEVQERAGQLAEVGARVAQGVGMRAAQVPTLVGQGTRLAGSVIRAANDTAPLVLQGITEFTDQLPLIIGFASAYAEVNAEQTQLVVQTFSRSLNCSLECMDIVTSQEKAVCEEKYCSPLPVEDNFSL